MTNFNPHRPEGIPTRMPAFEKACGEAGIAGYDFYRGAFMSYSGYQSMARVLKLMNATLRYTWSAEFMAGTWNKHLNTRVSDDHMLFMGLCALSQGCKAIAWFMFHDRDCWGDAPVSSHGHARPSLGVLRDIRKLAIEGIREWDQLVPQTDLGIIYDLASHEHTYLGDPSPCDDNAMHVGAPFIADDEAGCASMEYEGLFRLVEHTGRQAAVIDPVHCSERLNVKEMPLVLLPGSPVLHPETFDSLTRYVMQGGKLIVTGAWPTLNRNGVSIEFLGGSSPIQSKIKTAVGQGHIWWSPETLASEAEHDPEESIAWLRTIFETELTAPNARFEPIEPVSYVEWKRNVTMKSEGGHQPYTQPRNMLSGILHSGADDNILFLLNHYAEATRGRLTLANAKATSLENLLTGETMALVGGVAEIEIDRKTVLVFRVC